MNNSQKSRPYPIQSRDWPIAELPGLSYDNQTQLVECGISTTLALLGAASTPESRIKLANQLQIHVQYINKWVALADLARIPNVGCQYCGLLLHSGVSSVAQLALLPVHRLHQQVMRLQVGTMQRRDLCPSVDEMQQWIQQAVSLARSEKVKK